MHAREQYKWPLSPAILQRLGTASYGAQRAIYEDDQLLLVLHAPPVPGNLREHEIFLRIADGTAKGHWMYKGQKGGQPAMLHLLDRYEARLTQLQDALDGVKSSDDLFQIIGVCIPLARAAANCHKALQVARDAVKEDLWLIDQRDRAVELARGFELLLADARLELDYRLAKTAEEQARATHAVTRGQRKLNIIAALTFPIIAIGAIFGMNLRSGLEEAHWMIFWLVVLMSVGGGAYLIGWVRHTDEVPKEVTPKSLPKF